MCVDEAGINLNVAQVTSMFGSFIKYTVRTPNSALATALSTQPPQCNAFEILFQSQQIEMQTLPSRIDNPRN